jgi:replicative DNA helicase
MNENEIISSGIVDLDCIIKGFEKGKVYLISRRQSMGKSIFAVNISKHTAIELKINTLVFYLESTKENFFKRLISSQCFVDYSKFSNGMLDDKDFNSIAKEIEQITLANLLIDDNSTLTLDILRQKIELSEKSDLVIIDYLQLIEGDGNRKKVLSDFMLGLRKIAEEKNIPIIILSSLSDKCESRIDKRPLLSDLRNDGVPEQLADVVMFIYRDDFYDLVSEKKNITEIIVARNRGGSTGVVDVVFIPEKSMITNLENN